MFKSNYVSNADHIYYDISLYNNTNQPIQAKLFENRSTPLIQNPSDFHLSVVRFLIPSAYCPIFVYPNVYNPATLIYDPVDTSYSVTIKRGATVSQAFVQYGALNNLAQNTQQYYFIYSYQHFIDLINNAFYRAWQADTVAGGTAPSAPYMTFNPVTGLCSIVFDPVYLTQAGTYQVYMNNALFVYFDNFKTFRYGVGLPNGLDDQIYLENLGNNSQPVVPPIGEGGTGGTGYIVTQEYNSLYNWDTIRSLVLVTNTVPVVDENINVQAVTALTGSTYRRILTDFEPTIQTNASNNTLRSYLQYTPQGEYRLISMNSDRPLYTFDIQIFFETADQTLFPLFINAGEYISFKILFRDKNFKSGLSIYLFSFYRALNVKITSILSGFPEVLHATLLCYEWYKKL